MALKEQDIVFTTKDESGNTIIQMPITRLENVEGLEGLLDLMHPIGSLYWSKNATNPSTLFGGTWTQVKDKFILAAGDSYAQGATGGEAAHKLTVNEMPSHNHSASTNTTGDHTHPVSWDYGTQGSDSWNAFGKSYNNYKTASSRFYMQAAGAHSHTVTVNSTGGGAAHNNMPPYVAYYCWERTA